MMLNYQCLHCKTSLMLLTCILKVPSSNFDKDNSYFPWGLFDSPQFLQANLVIRGHECLLPQPLQFIKLYSFYGSVLHGLAYRQNHSTNKQTNIRKRGIGPKLPLLKLHKPVFPSWSRVTYFSFRYTDVRTRLPRSAGVIASKDNSNTEWWNK